MQAWHKQLENNWGQGSGGFPSNAPVGPFMCDHYARLHTCIAILAITPPVLHFSNLFFTFRDPTLPLSTNFWDPQACEELDQLCDLKTSPCFGSRPPPIHRARRTRRLVEAVDPQGKCLPATLATIYNKEANDVQLRA